MRNRNNNILSSDKKQNITFEEQNSQLRIYNSERKNMNTYLEFRNESPSPHPNIRVNQISTSWKNEAAEIKDKYINNATSNFKGGSICTKT